MTNAPSASTVLRYKINFKNALVTLARHVEALFVRHVAYIKKTVRTIMRSISVCKQKVRPNRSYKKPPQQNLWVNSGSGRRPS